VGCRAFGETEILQLVSKLKRFTTYYDRKILEDMISNEIYHYKEIKHDCPGIIDMIWKLARCVMEKRIITITYHKQDRKLVERKIMPIALTFSEFYFYLIAYRCDKKEKIPLYYRVDRMERLIEHREHFKLAQNEDFDEGELRNKIQFMQAGKCRKVKFSYSGPSVQAILDKLPTAKVVESGVGYKIITAETYGRGINMFLLSQGSMVQVMEPQELVDEMAEEIRKMDSLYPPKSKLQGK
jgi:predicted DNA-binding transcriptional regulator YafY